MLPGSILVYTKLNEVLRSEQTLAFILGNRKGKGKVMQCYDIKLQWLLAKKRESTRLSGEKLVISFPTLDNFFVHPNLKKATRRSYHPKNQNHLNPLGLVPFLVSDSQPHSHIWDQCSHQAAKQGSSCLAGWITLELHVEINIGWEVWAGLYSPGSYLRGDLI